MPVPPTTVSNTPKSASAPRARLLAALTHWFDTEASETEVGNDGNRIDWMRAIPFLSDAPRLSRGVPGRHLVDRWRDRRRVVRSTCEGGFRERSIGVAQLLMAKPGHRAPAPMPERPHRRQSGCELQA